jgi:hypothetical protein
VTMASRGNLVMSPTTTVKRREAIFVITEPLRLGSYQDCGHVYGLCPT